MAYSPIILASGSPRRRELLTRMGVAFTVVPAEVTEREWTSGDPASIVMHNAELKASWVAKRNPGRLVLGSDTAVALGERIFHKPADMAEARAMLFELSGNTHTVFTGVALIRDNETQVFCETSQVTFQALDDARIDAYFAQVNPLDKAGAYGIQAGRELIIANVAGSVDNVMGLPTERLRAHLDRHAAGVVN